jgi:hypothetical protein
MLLALDFQSVLEKVHQVLIVGELQGQLVEVQGVFDEGCWAAALGLVVNWVAA